MSAISCLDPEPENRQACEAPDDDQWSIANKLSKDSTLEKLPTEILSKILRSLKFSDVAIAFTCPRMYVMFKHLFPGPISLCNTDVAPQIEHFDSLRSKSVHSKLVNYSPLLSIYQPEDYTYRVITCTSTSTIRDSGLGITRHLEYYGRFLRRPYYDDEKNCKDLKNKYRNYELYVHSWTGEMEKILTYPYPHNKGPFVYKMELKQATYDLLDSMADITSMQYNKRTHFLKNFLDIGSYKEVNALINGNLYMIYFSQWREMMDF